MMAMAASPTPNTSTVKAHNHPPYKEMITSAIESLKEHNGSSKVAIAKYIESNYKDLPSTHDALLSHHLRRLKKQGVLQMVVKSYKLSDSGNAPQNPEKRRGRPPKKAIQSSDLNQGTEKKRRGRPRKVPAQGGAGPPGMKRGLGRPRKILSVGRLVLPGNAEPVVKTEKRRPGRPRKGSSPATMMALGVKKKRGRPRKVLPPFKPKLAVALPLGDKRKRGRPKKVDALPAVGEKRKRGRPRKLDAFISLAEKMRPGPPKTLDASLLPAEKRKRGRPRKLDAFLAPGEKRKLGRPKKLAGVLASGEKKRGRPKKVDAVLIPGERKRGRPRIKPAGGLAPHARRKPGRPRKNPLSVEPNAATMSVSGEKRKRGRPKKISAAMGNGGENVVRIPEVQCTAGELLDSVSRGHDNLLAVLMAADTVGGFSSAVENGGGVLPVETQTLPANTVEREDLEGAATMPLLASTMSGEKRKRGRPKKGLAPSSPASAVNGGNAVPNSMLPSAPRGRGRPSKQGSPVSMPTN